MPRAVVCGFGCSTDFIKKSFMPRSASSVVTSIPFVCLRNCCAFGSHKNENKSNPTKQKMAEKRVHPDDNIPKKKRQLVEDLTKYAKSHYFIINIGGDKIAGGNTITIFDPGELTDDWINTFQRWSNMQRVPDSYFQNNKPEKRRLNKLFCAEGLGGHQFKNRVLDKPSVLMDVNFTFK
jgi:hypothetical protein